MSILAARLSHPSSDARLRAARVALDEAHECAADALYDVRQIDTHGPVQECADSLVPRLERINLEISAALDDLRAAGVR